MEEFVLDTASSSRFIFIATLCFVSTVVSCFISASTYVHIEPIISKYINSLVFTHLECRFDGNLSAYQIMIQFECNTTNTERLLNIHLLHRTTFY